MSDSTHECPIDGCPKRVDHHQLMCLSHWRMVPGEIGRKLYRAYDRGRGIGSNAHAEAMHDAVHWVEMTLASKSEKTT